MRACAGWYSLDLVRGAERLTPPDSDERRCGVLPNGCQILMGWRGRVPRVARAFSAAVSQREPFLPTMANAGSLRGA